MIQKRKFYTHLISIRQDHILDFLTDLSEQVQIIIMTCHTDRYHGFGKVVGI